ncbi:amidohydrolase family protein, partial [Anaerobutyricum hallii]|nr:amidohydrolase family protein [Anaerobutyricum hallii]
DKILFGTDSPWENQLDYVKRISNMDFTKEALEQILSENAKTLFTS